MLAGISLIFFFLASVAGVKDRLLVVSYRKGSVTVCRLFVEFTRLLVKIPAKRKQQNCNLPLQISNEFDVCNNKLLLQCQMSELTPLFVAVSDV